MRKVYFQVHNRMDSEDSANVRKILTWVRKTNITGREICYQNHLYMYIIKIIYIYICLCVCMFVLCVLCGECFHTRLILIAEAVCLFFPARIFLLCILPRYLITTYFFNFEESLGKAPCCTTGCGGQCPEIYCGYRAPVYPSSHRWHTVRGRGFSGYCCS